MTVIERDEAEAVRLLMMYEVKRALELLDDEPLGAAERDCG